MTRATIQTVGNISKLTSTFAIILAILAAITLTPKQAHAAPTTHNFNNTSLSTLLTNDFRQALSESNAFGYNTDGGLDETGAINVLTKNNIWTGRQTYAIPQDNETVTLGGYFFSTNQSGYGGLGISTKRTNPPANGVPNPETGLGVVFHGNSGDFMMGGQSIGQLTWDNGDFNLHQPEWWFMNLEIIRDGATYDMHFEIYMTDSTGVLGALHTEHSISNVSMPALNDASAMWTYFGATSGRFSQIDNVSIDATPIAEPQVESDLFDGEGTLVDPFLINDCEQLQAINDDTDYLEAHFALNQNIDCSMTNPDDEDFDPDGTWGDEQGFQPIGGSDYQFNGTLDGQQYTVQGLFINRIAIAVGLFGTVGKIAEISDIGVVDAMITGDLSVGSLVGILYGTVSNSYSTGVVTGAAEVGGLVGSNYWLGGSSTIEDSYATNTVSGEQAVGGLIGESHQGYIINSHASGNVTGELNVGGLLGYDLASTTSDSYATGQVSGIDTVGGLTGFVYGSSISDSYATGEVDGIEGIGGLVGYAGATSYLYSPEESEWVNELVITSIEDVYATGDVSGNYRVGGLVGDFNGGTIMRAAARGNAIGIVHPEDNDVLPENVGGFAGIHDKDTYDYYDEDLETWGETDLPALTSQSSATGNVSGAYGVGGFVGINIRESSIVDSYARGNVTAIQNFAENIGGFAGTSETSELLNVYATGRITAGQNSDEVGGLLGFDDSGSTTNSFWDTETTDYEVSAGGTGKTSANMKTVATYTDLETEGLDETWDFVGNPNDDENDSDIWTISSDSNNGYPCLTWEDEADLCANLPETPDSDNDGIADNIEDAGPNNGDANNDGIPDRQQAYVTSFVNIITGHYVVVVVDAACNLSSVSTASESNNTIQDAGYNYLSGLINFTAECATVGITTPVTIYQYDVNQNNLLLRKYKPTTNAYFTITGSSLSQQTIGSQTATVASYTITDGGELDLDNQANGIIVDPVGLAQSVIGTPNTGIFR